MERIVAPIVVAVIALLVRPGARIPARLQPLGNGSCFRSPGPGATYVRGSERT
jgi:hypothetical protein